MNRELSSGWRGLRALAISTAIALLLGSGAARAQQFVDASDGKTRQAEISAAEMTRIAFEGGRIRSIKYDETELLVSEDNAIGQLFVRPLVKGKTLAVFVITSTGTTHALELTPGATGLTTIIIQEPKKADLRSEAVATSSGRPATERLTVLDAQLRRLLGAMARDDRLVEFEKIPQNRELSLWQGTRFFLLNAWTGRGFRGEAYRLLNESPSPMRMVEQEFYTQGVIAVSIEIHDLPPGASTNVFVVRREALK
jgi:conjugal transfer pilus assembly protein TraK